MAPDSFGSGLGCCLKHKGNVTALNMALHSKGNQRPWQYIISPGHCSDHSMYQSAVSTETSVARAHTLAKTSVSWLPWGINTFYAGTWKTVRPALGSELIYDWYPERLNKIFYILPLKC